MSKIGQYNLSLKEDDMQPDATTELEEEQCMCMEAMQERADERRQAMKEDGVSDENQSS